MGRYDRPNGTEPDSVSPHSLNSRARFRDHVTGRARIVSRSLPGSPNVAATEPTTFR